MEYPTSQLHFLFIPSDKWDIPWYTTRERCITSLYHAIESTMANTIKATYARRMMGTLDGTSSNMQRLSSFWLGVVSVARYNNYLYLDLSFMLVQATNPRSLSAWDCKSFAKSCVLPVCVSAFWSVTFRLFRFEEAAKYYLELLANIVDMRSVRFVSV